jgi:hypothetical protein
MKLKKLLNLSLSTHVHGGADDEVVDGMEVELQNGGARAPLWTVMWLRL